MNVLVVDDHPLARAAISEVIEAQGHRVAAAVATGADALRVAQGAPLDLAIVDVRLTGESGYDVRDALLVVQPELSVVLMSMGRRGEHGLGRSSDARPIPKEELLGIDLADLLG